jgi:hypothetical protein
MSKYLEKLGQGKTWSYGCLSRVPGNGHARFLGERRLVIVVAYPTLLLRFYRLVSQNIIDISGLQLQAHSLACHFIPSQRDIEHEHN